MCQPLSLRPPPPPESPVEAFALLILNYKWEPAELAECDCFAHTFVRIVALLRQKVVEVGFIDPDLL